MNESSKRSAAASAKPSGVTLVEIAMPVGLQPIELPCEDCTAPVTTTHVGEQIRRMSANLSLLAAMGMPVDPPRRLCRTCIAVEASIACERSARARMNGCERQTERSRMYAALHQQMAQGRIGLPPLDRAAVRRA